MKTEILGKDGLEAASLNRKKAIRERCLNCSGWSAKAVAGCGFTGCPFQYRPLTIDFTREPLLPDMPRKIKVCPRRLPGVVDGNI